MKHLYIIVSITSACFFLLCAPSRAEGEKNIAQKTAAAPAQNTKWEYYKEDWFKYVDDLTGAIPIMDLPAGPKVNPKSPALSELKTDLGFSDVDVSSVVAIVELYAQFQELGKERGQIETRMGLFEGNDKSTQEYRKEMGSRGDKLYSQWKSEIKSYDQKIEAKLHTLKKVVVSFNSQLPDKQKTKFLDWKKRKIKENWVKQQEDWKKQKQILDTLHKGK